MKCSLYSLITLLHFMSLPSLCPVYLCTVKTQWTSNNSDPFYKAHWAHTQYQLQRYWNNVLSLGILPLNTPSGVLSWTAQIWVLSCWNRQGWLKVPHIANAGVFNQGGGRARSQPKILGAFLWLDGRGQLRTEKPAELWPGRLTASLGRPYQECEMHWGLNSCWYKLCLLKVKTPTSWKTESRK